MCAPIPFAWAKGAGRSDARANAGEGMAWAEHGVWRMAGTPRWRGREPEVGVWPTTIPKLEIIVDKIAGSEIVWGPVNEKGL